MRKEFVCENVQKGATVKIELPPVGGPWICYPGLEANSERQPLSNRLSSREPPQAGRPTRDGPLRIAGTELNSDSPSASTDGGDRTPDHWFWRPALYQLSYIRKGPQGHPESAG